MQFIRFSILIITGCFITSLFTDSYSQKSINFEKPSKDEIILYNLINVFRAANDKSVIKLSKSLSYVAKTHVKDLMAHPPKGRCNMHSWSADGPWTPCCYTPDHAKASCMWNKPKELTNYKGYGFENSHWRSINVNPFSALDGWKTSPGHNAVILGIGVWSDKKWQSIGVGIYKNYAVIWFGEEVDPDGYW